MISSVVSSAVCSLCAERSFKVVKPKIGVFLERNIFPEKKCPHCACLRKTPGGSVGTWCSSFGLVSSRTLWSFNLLECPVTTENMLSHCISKKQV